MEKKKLLFVAISVGIFLVIAIGAAIVVFAPKTGPVPSATVASRSGQDITVLPPSSYPLGSYDPNAAIIPNDPNTPQPSSVDAVDLLRNPSTVPGLRPAPEGTAPQGSDYYLNGSGRNGDTLINVPKPSTAAVPDTPAAPRTSATATPPRPAPTAAAPVTPAPVAVAPAPAAPAVQARPASVQTRLYDDFWVQTGAFSTIARAELVKDDLASKGITSIIENRDVEGRTVFRVRVGPYTSQNEADYWLSLIKSINGFEESQVRQTQSRR
jgi:DedD protein